MQCLELGQCTRKSLGHWKRFNKPLLLSGCHHTGHLGRLHQLGPFKWLHLSSDLEPLWQWASLGGPHQKGTQECLNFLQGALRGCHSGCLDRPEWAKRECTTKKQPSIMGMATSGLSLCLGWSVWVLPLTSFQPTSFCSMAEVPWRRLSDHS